MCSPPKRREATASVSKDYGPAVDCVRGRDGEHPRTGMLPLSAALLRSINILEERGGEGEAGWEGTHLYQPTYQRSGKARS